MSSYDDPRWHEEQPNNTNELYRSAQPAHDDFDRYPFLPAAEQAIPQEQNGFTPSPARSSSARLQRFLGQALVTIALVVIAFWGGWFCHQYFGNSFNQSDQSRAYSQMVQDAWTKIDQNYVDRENVNYKKMAYSAITAMVSTLNDPGHSRFMDPQTVKDENQQLSGKFTGIGIYLHQDTKTKQLIITAPIPGSPAEKAGLKPGDILLSINGTDMTGKDINAASTLIQGESGTDVTLTIQRPGVDKPMTFKVTRAEIEVPNVIMHYIAESHIAHIQIVQFAQGVSGQVRDDITKAKAMGATKIILDLRDNPGGYLNEAINTVSLFVKNGNVLLEKDSSGQITPIAVNGNPLDTNSQMVVLINNYSASAAEIVSAALHDNNRAYLIGDHTFGTGTVLEQFNLADGSALYLGTQEWLTPKGKFIRQKAGDPHSGGIDPDQKVILGPNAIAVTPNEENQANMTLQQILDSGDTQLIAAIQYLNGNK